MSTAIVAFGGNALVTDAEHDSIPQQYETVSRTVPPLIDMVEQGWKLVVSHGNGPQVGFILRRSELAQDEVDPVPVDYAVADTQGAIGYMFVKALRNELARRGLSRPVVAVVTHSVVSLDDPAFQNPTKPVGSFLDEAKAKEMAATLGWTIAEDAGRGWRRTVASPQPTEILETDLIRRLLDDGAIVVAVGGGGIPVTRRLRRDRRRRGSRGGQGPCLRSARPRPGCRPADDPHRRAAGGHRVRHARRRSGSTRSPSRRLAATSRPVSSARARWNPRSRRSPTSSPRTPGATGVIGAAEEIPAILAGTSGTRIVGDSAATKPAPRQADTGAVLLAVNGTLMRGLKLSPNMAAAGASFVREADTEPVYRIWTVNDDHPAMIRVTDGSGVAVAVEVWSVPAAGLAGILLNEPPGLSIGKVNLADGSTVLGVLGEPALVEGQREISQHGGWRAYTAAEGVSS